MNKNFFLIFILLILTSCASDNAAKMVSNIRTNLKHKHGIKDGEIIAKFDLAGMTKDEKIFASYYGPSINSHALNQKFLNEFERVYRHKDLIQENSGKKITMLSNTLIKLNHTHKILHKSIIASLKQHNHKAKLSPKNKEDFFTQLVNLHNKTKHIPLFVPEELPRVTSKFGTRRHPTKGKIIHHCGLDLAGRMGTKIFSAADGIIEEVSRSRGYGNSVIVRHSPEIKTRYAHLGKFAVREGERVILGQSLGTQGCSGTATGHHLHFEVLIRGKVVDPMDFISHSL